MFQHEPLDRDKSSIRLIEVQPDVSPEGLIQCQMFHDVIGNALTPKETKEDEQMVQGIESRNSSQDDAVDQAGESAYESKDPGTSIASTSADGCDDDGGYSCLSYTWGTEDPDSPILINGRTFHVRRNLFQFLEVAVVRYPLRKLWIDALCIDQNNTAERNHQVQQMGHIYSQAKEVLIWLGHCPDLENTFCKPIPWDHQEKFWAMSALHLNEYWGRAWITQEVVLAKSTVIILGKKHLDLSMLTLQDELLFSRLFLNMLTAVKSKRSGANATFERDRKILNLLHQFRGRKDHEPRDRIYSLLALCRDRNTPKVSYDSTDVQVLHETLATQRQSLCICSVSAAVFALWPPASFRGVLEEADRPIIDATFESITVTMLDSLRISYPKDGYLLSPTAFCRDYLCADELYWAPQTSIPSQTKANSGLVPGVLYFLPSRSSRKKNQGTPYGREVLGRHSVTSHPDSPCNMADVVTLRLSVATLVDLVRRNYIYSFRERKRCPNLWHEARDANYTWNGLVKLLDG